MKRYMLILVIGISLTCINCQEPREDNHQPLTEKETYQYIGEEIPFHTGMEWIEYYRNQQTSEGRTALFSRFQMSDSLTIKLLNSTDNLVGIAFHWAIDHQGKIHILVIPVDESLRLWTATPERIIVDANTGTPINRRVAYKWAANYKKVNPSGVWFHFFGANIFDDMCALPFFETVNIEPAINILNLKPQLLLVVYNNGQYNIGRTAYDPPGVVYDASSACPPCHAN